jgi:predicted secreted hydrolase
MMKSLRAMICMAGVIGSSLGFGSGAARLNAEEFSARWSIPQPGHVLDFPRDHGSHPDFKIEWWYLTGHLFAGERRFGFQATFFRLGQSPEEVASGELFGSSQLHLAHMGISDPVTGEFYHEERLQREGWDAVSEQGRLEIRNGNWSLRSLHPDDALSAMELTGSVDADVAFSLQLVPEQSHVVFGEDGISRKGPEGSAASYYITFPRLAVTGVLSLGQEELSVQGEAWMDHEISSSQLDRSQVGWDWACLQFFDGRELMGYILRTADGKVSEYSKLVWIGAEGKLVHQRAKEFEWRAGGAWKSPRTGATYPISPTLVTTDPASGARRELRLIPTMPNQEMGGAVGGVSYWEGACDVRDELTGEIVGRAFLEMTGYADDIASKLR